MERWTQYDEDVCRLSRGPGIKIMGYSPDNGEYFLTGGWKGAKSTSTTLTTVVHDLWVRYKPQERTDPLALPIEPEDRPTRQFALPIYARFSNQSDSLSTVSQTGSKSSSRHTRSPTTPELSRLAKDRRVDREAEDRTPSRESSVLASRSLERLAVVPESPSSRRQSSFSSTNATIGSGSHVHFITQTDLPPPPPPKDSHSFRTASASFSSSDPLWPWLTEDGSASSLPYLRVSSKSDLDSCYQVVPRFL